MLLRKNPVMIVLLLSLFSLEFGSILPAKEVPYDSLRATQADKF